MQNSDKKSQNTGRIIALLIWLLNATALLLDKWNLQEEQQPISNVQVIQICIWSYRSIFNKNTLVVTVQLKFLYVEQNDTTLHLQETNENIIY
jgi:hypothetical protein